MLTIQKLDFFLKNLFKTEGLKDHCPIGLQVTGAEKITKIALGVSANLAFFKKATANACEACLTHHGLFWQKEWPFVIDEIWKQRLQFLFEHNLNLLAYHYPLDSHAEIGNNSQILQKLDCKIEQPFGFDGYFSWGWKGTFKQAILFNELVNKTTKIFGLKGVIFPFGKKKVKTIGVVSGGGSFALREAIQKNLEVFLTGSLQESDQEIAREAKINIIAPGHYVTEQFGIKSLGKIIEKEFKTKTIFLDVPNSL